MSGMRRSGGGGKEEEFIWNLKSARERVKAVGRAALVSSRAALDSSGVSVPPSTLVS